MQGDILVATDGSEVATRATDSAIELATLLDSTLHVISVRENDSHDVDAIVEDAASEARNEGCTVETAVKTGRPSREIREYADEIDADLVVIGTHGRTGIRQVVLGSVALEVVRESRRPVLTVGADAEPIAPLDRILLATDGWSGSDGATEYALELADVVGASLQALYVVDVDTEVAELAEGFESHGSQTTAAVVDRGEKRGLNVEGTLARGETHDVILEYANQDETDLLVMGTESKSNLERLVIGSVSQRVVPNAKVPVLTVRTVE